MIFRLNWVMFWFHVNFLRFYVSFSKGTTTVAVSGA